MSNPKRKALGALHREVMFHTKAELIQASINDCEAFGIGKFSELMAKLHWHNEFTVKLFYRYKDRSVGSIIAKYELGIVDVINVDGYKMSVVYDLYAEAAANRAEDTKAKPMIPIAAAYQSASAVVPPFRYNTIKLICRLVATKLQIGHKLIGYKIGLEAIEIKGVSKLIKETAGLNRFTILFEDYVKAEPLALGIEFDAATGSVAIEIIEAASHYAPRLQRFIEEVRALESQEV